MSKNSHKDTMCRPSELSGSEAPQTMLPDWESLVSESLFNGQLLVTMFTIR